MSKFFKWMAGAILLSIGIMLAMPAQRASAQPGVSVSIQAFYDELSPYGQWIDYPQYGYVWSPRMGRDFRPYYSGGHWVMTEYGNTWVSDYSWGWAPFHYGRWAYDPGYGWIWIPGQEWGPAWVSWRSGGDNYGWAPMGPNISINFSFGPSYAPPMDWWVFVPCRQIYSPRFHNYWRGPGYNNRYYNNTTIINNTYITNNNTYVFGPRRSDVERATGQKVNVYNVRSENRPGNTVIRGNAVNVYRPRVDAGRADYRPNNVVRATNNGNDVIGGNTRAMQSNDRQAQQRMDQNTVREAPVRSISGRNTQQMQEAQRQNAEQVSRQRDMQVEQQQNAARIDRQREMQAQQQQQMQQQRDVQARQEQQQNAERVNRQREMQAQQQQQQRDAQMQQQRQMQARQEQQQNAERMNRQREMLAQQQMQQQRDAQVQQQRQMQARQEQQSRAMQQQRAVEERARQQQAIENSRSQRWENQQRPQPQQRENYNRGGDVQMQQRPQQQMSEHSGMSRGRR